MAKYDHYYDGQQRLKELLPWARDVADKSGSEGLKLLSGVGKAWGSHAREDNLDALIIYPGPRGGWHADLVLKKVPAGVTNTLGTQTSKPCRTRDEAIDMGKSLLLSVLVFARRKERQEPLGPVFHLFDWEIALHGEALEFLQEMSGGTAQYPDKETTMKRIGDTVTGLFPAGFSKERFDALDKEGKAQLLAVLTMAALSGVMVYPPTEDKPPSPIGGGEQ